MRIYVAGKYSDDNIIGCLDNIKLGIKVCARILKEGNEPFCPWLDYQLHFFEDLTVKDYYRYSIAWLKVSEEMWVLPNYKSSKGTRAELVRARELNIPVKFLEE